MFCAISGESPQVPVVSRKSGKTTEEQSETEKLIVAGNVYEKHLIEAYISENGTEPTTGDSLTVEDLLDVKLSRTVRPRPPSLTSIPALLGVFQEEWDALALETYNLQQNLAQTRQELSTALYQYDAAVRMIAKLTRERDEARDALSKIDVGARATAANGTNGDAMQIDNAPLPGHVIAKIETTQEKLMKTRRKRPIPDGWATADEISGYTVTATSDPLYPGTKFLATNSSGDQILLGGADGIAGIYSTDQRQIVQALKGGSGAITSGVWSGDRAVVSTSTGVVKVFEGQNEIASFKSHSGSVTALALHPCGDILASVSVDKSYVLYDLETLEVLSQVYSDSELACAQFHPDGHLLAVGGSDSQLKFYDVKSGAIGGTFDTGTPLKALFFSENGTWVAVANSGSSVVSIWDLRKVGASTEPIKTLDVGGAVESLFWDYTAQYLLAGGPAGVSVEQYTKSTKEWSEPLRLGVPANSIAWGPSARSIFAVSTDGLLSVVS